MLPHQRAAFVSQNHLKLINPMKDSFFYLPDALVSPNPILIHYSNFQRVIFEFLHWNEKLKLLVKFRIQRVFLHCCLFLFRSLATMMQPDFRIRIF